MTLSQIRAMEQRGRKNRQQRMDPNRAGILRDTGRPVDPMREPRSAREVMLAAGFEKLKEAVK